MNGEKLIYIAGYGRSGSTIFSVILDAHPQLAGMGEICHVLSEWAAPGRICACGEPYSDCDFWRQLHRQARPPLRLVRQIEGAWALPAALRGYYPLSDVPAYCNFQRRLLEHIRLHTGKPCVVDASKTAWFAMARPLALQNILREDLYLIHLVRNGLAVTQSQVLKGKNRDLETGVSRAGSAWLTIFGWVAANLAVVLLARQLPADRVLRIRFEDLIQYPETVIRQIGAWSDLDMSQVLHRLEHDDPFPIGHLVAGNRLRFDEKLHLQRNLKSAPGSGLHSRQRRLFTIMAGWLQRRYGYES